MCPRNKNPGKTWATKPDDFLKEGDNLFNKTCTFLSVRQLRAPNISQILRSKVEIRRLQQPLEKPSILGGGQGV